MVYRSLDNHVLVFKTGEIFLTVWQTDAGREQKITAEEQAQAIAKILNEHG